MDHAGGDGGQGDEHAGRAEEGAAGADREDLPSRIGVLEIHLPPLRERREDGPALAGLFAKHLAGDAVRFDRAAMRALEAHSRPGHVRELGNVVERALACCEGRLIRPEHLPPWLRTASVGQLARGGTLPPLEGVERAHVEAVPQETGGQVELAAERLGLGRSAPCNRMRWWPRPLPRSRR